MKESNMSIEQLWEYASKNQQVGFNGGYYYIETITQDFYPNIPRLVVILSNKNEDEKDWKTIEVTKKEDLDKISFPFY
jgi:hypothetical protein